MEPNQDPKIKKGAIRWLRRETMGNLVLIAILFGIVGRWDWWMGWVLSAMYIVWSASIAILILPVNPAMLAERARPHSGTEKWDMILLGVMGFMMVVEYVIASLDVRQGWSPQVPLILQISGLAIAILGHNFLFVWAMVSNAFFVATVRLQTDRKHAVVSNGPYRYLRHPGYMGALLLHLGTPFMLGSYWALIPAVLTALVLIVRTILEDKFLRENLDGYAEYAQRVPYRLLPGIW